MNLRCAFSADVGHFEPVGMQQGSREHDKGQRRCFGTSFCAAFLACRLRFLQSRPPSTTRMRSQCRTVESRCATATRVPASASSESLTCFCVLLSSALVASSNRRMRLPPHTARAISNRWRCPPDTPPDPSVIRVCIPWGILRMSSAMPATRLLRLGRGSSPTAGRKRVPSRLSGTRP